MKLAGLDALMPASVCFWWGIPTGAQPQAHKQLPLLLVPLQVTTQYTRH